MNNNTALFIYILSVVTVLMLAVIEIADNGISRRMFVLFLLIAVATIGMRRLKATEEKRDFNR